MESQILTQLSKPFSPASITWKPGAVKNNRALALAYADLRVYMNRLDEICGGDWSVAYEPWGENRLICRLTIGGVTRSSTGESTNESERSEIGGTVAEAQAFKRACAMFGLGRYLYTLPSVWEEYDPATRQFTAQAKTKLTQMLVNHYRRAIGDDQPTHPNREIVPPTDAELDILGSWKTPADAQQWAVEVGACLDLAEAKEIFTRIVKENGGRLTPANVAKIYVLFLRETHKAII